MGKKYKIIAGIPTRDEEWIIEKQLKTLEKFCDKIIIVDDSKDRTPEICKTFDKVELHLRGSNKLLDEGKFRQELIEHISKHEPDYVILLDCDEIISPNIIDFFENIDENIVLWTLPEVNLWRDKYHYRIDKYRTKLGANVNWDPFNNGPRRPFIMKFNKNIKYDYDITRDKGVGSLSPFPENVPFPHKNIDEVVVLHYGRIGEKFTSGYKHELYAKVEEENWGANYEQRLEHHKLCGSEETLKLEKIKPEWVWEGIND